MYPFVPANIPNPFNIKMCYLSRIFIIKVLLIIPNRKWVSLMTFGDSEGPRTLLSSQTRVSKYHGSHVTTSNKSAVTLKGCWSADAEEEREKVRERQCGLGRYIETQTERERELSWAMFSLREEWFSRCAMYLFHLRKWKAHWLCTCSLEHTGCFWVMLFIQS